MKKVFSEKGVKDCNLIKKETQAQVFSCKFCEIFKNTFFRRTPPVATSECYFPFLSKYEKTRGLLMLSGDIKRKYFSKMDQELVINPEKSDQNLIS